MLVTEADLKPDEWVLIVGAGGGIATAALQIAAVKRSRTVVVSGDEEKLSAARKSGADHAINSWTQFAKAARTLTGKHGADVVVNCVGGTSWADSLAALARGGRLVTCGAVAGRQPKTDLRRVFWNHLKILAVSSGSRQEFLQVLNFLSASQRKPILDQIFPLEEARWAHRRLEERKQFGKIVLRMD